ncbi:MAG: isochorismatase family protein [Bifidobacteriaceae bacterium]|jgi:nicotinamidase-related amidase|nr:isochorismatase family protein [Bifidobacteriaceae bacterium]
MTSYPPRDPAKDQLLSPSNSALLVIDYQPTQFQSLQSHPQEQIIEKIVSLSRIGVIYGLPIVLSTVNVSNGREQDTSPRLKSVLQGVASYDRTAINAWEDQQFNEAVHATGRKKLLIAALWTEACLTFPTLDALAEGFEVYPVVDAVAGTSLIAHDTALKRVHHAGAQVTTVVQVLCELQRDWNRTQTVQPFVQEMFATHAFPQY